MGETLSSERSEGIVLAGAIEAGAVEARVLEGEGVLLWDCGAATDSSWPGRSSKTDWIPAVASKATVAIAAGMAIFMLMGFTGLRKCNVV